MYRTILLLAGALAVARAQNHFVLTGPRLRVEASSERGHLREHYFARDETGWIELATHDGATVVSLSASRDALFEELQLDGRRIQRTVRLTTSEHWFQTTSRLEVTSPITLHSFSDTLRAAFQPDWSYAPSVGGFVPDAQYKAPLILVQSGRRAMGIVPDVMALTAEVLQRCQHAIDLDVPAGPLLSVGFIPARQAYHSVYQEEFDRKWSVDRSLENSYFLYLSANAAPQAAYREAVRFHWDQFGRKLMETAAIAQTGTDPSYEKCGLWDDWRRVVWEEESPRNWLSFTLPGGGTGGAVKMMRWGEPNPSVYLGAWFNSLRTSFGMALYARRKGSTKLMDLARQTVQIALHAPGLDGAFRCIAVPPAVFSDLT